eukprot:CAMPEP_0194111726 /NCGR_PEP_ID=MMETSP0150-20130528/10654_1 /TAXON_ID=122233 /ORGANISM="Chaetoceros debilis, Strain MM31A-1" /LENGTH=537 /DNA_ID=CAMNT_0038801227 /DNA_START=117 /DNA_END=1732 /DNA_ORIENTATION=-
MTAVTTSTITGTARKRRMEILATTRENGHGNVTVGIESEHEHTRQRTTDGIPRSYNVTDEENAIPSSVSVASASVFKHAPNPNPNPTPKTKYQNRYEPDVPMTKEQAADWRREARRKRNRESAAASRNKVRSRISELETEVDEWKDKYEGLLGRIRKLEQLDGTGSAMGLNMGMSMGMGMDIGGMGLSVPLQGQVTPSSAFTMSPLPEPGITTSNGHDNGVPHDPLFSIMPLGSLDTDALALTLPLDLALPDVHVHVNTNSNANVPQPLAANAITSAPIKEEAVSNDLPVAAAAILAENPATKQPAVAAAAGVDTATGAVRHDPEFHLIEMTSRPAYHVNYNLTHNTYIGQPLIDWSRHPLINILQPSFKNNLSAVKITGETHSVVPVPVPTPVPASAAAATVAVAVNSVLEQLQMNMATKSASARSSASVTVPVPFTSATAYAHAPRMVLDVDSSSRASLSSLSDNDSGTGTGTGSCSSSSAVTSDVALDMDVDLDLDLESKYDFDLDDIDLDMNIDAQDEIGQLVQEALFDIASD